MQLPCLRRARLHGLAMHRPELSRLGAVRRPLAAIMLAAALVVLATGHGCAPRVGCMGGDDGQCLPPSACQALHYECSDPMVNLRVVEGITDRPPGLDALAAAGDILLENDRLVAVIDALDAPHYLAPSGGGLLDLVAKRAGAGDQLNQIVQTIGILPHDAARYHSMQLLDHRPDSVGALLRGRLDLRPEMQIVTRYELRPCEPGIRIRTELYHAGRDPITVFLSDGYFWGDREVTPFIPLRGRGFVHPELELDSVGDAMVDSPWVAAQSHTPAGAAYAAVPCGCSKLSGFHSETISLAGLEPTILMPGDSIAFERFILVAAPSGLHAATNLALQARNQLFDERHVRLSGRAVAPSGEPVGGDERLVSLLIYEPAPGSNPDAREGRRPWTEVVPDADGSFEVWLPAERRFRVETHVLGRALPDRTSFRVGIKNASLDDLVVPAVGVIEASVAGTDGNPLIAELVLVPAAPTTAAQVRGSIHGQFAEEQCAPYLGPPHGASPACNRVLVGPSGETSFAAPEGSFFVYATRGPFWTLARERVEVRSGERTRVAFTLEKLDLLPEGALSADLHVHAGASFDSSLPERDRALTFVASGLDVIAATDHEVVTDYASAIAELGLEGQVHVMPGVETTGHILFLYPPGVDIPRVIGHYNFWPLRHDANRPRNGAPDDERIEPGALFDRMQRHYSGRGVAQANHPLAEGSLGRDTAYLMAIEYDPRVPVPDVADDTSAGQLRRRPAGGKSNLDYDVQEVMNGFSLQQFLRYRTLWHSFLNQGILRAGTANSDSHTFAVEVVGYPRNIVFGGHRRDAFDQERFNADVRAGHTLGTNGPVIIACLTGTDGDCHPHSLRPVRPAPDAQLHLEVRAAPWIPVQEIRIIVNGSVVRKIAAQTHPASPLSDTGLLRYQGRIALSGLVPPDSRDVWVVVEAGLALPLVADLDDDGLADTTDNNHDGLVDGTDRAAREQDDFSEAPPPEESDPRFHLNAVAPKTWPTAFTNPWLIDFDGDGWQAPGLR